MLLTLRKLLSASGMTLGIFTQLTPMKFALDGILVRYHACRVSIATTMKANNADPVL